MRHEESRSTSSQSGSLVEQLAEEYLARLRNGESPSVSEYAEAHPNHADEILDVFPTLAMLEDVAPDADDQAGAVSTPLVNAPQQLGEYRIIRELGRGGMGVVYEAEHHTMRRRVALKVLFPHTEKQGHGLERFLREARAAGRLHHTNIVPVFEVGSENGMHFYSMQRIRGQNLDAVIDDLKRIQAVPEPPHGGDSGIPASTAHRLLSGEFQSWNVGSTDELDAGKTTSVDVRRANERARSTGSSAKIVVPESSEMSNVGEDREGYFHRVARVGLQVAEALAYAHAHGILHRDIKPSNLILDTEGTVWITDFGLARSEGDALTHTGDIVGTLRYTAPERFRGQADARSDVYSLGLTLYELCTLRCAFDQDVAADLIRHVMHDDPANPSRHNAEIPRDLETIILKSIARHPSARYQNATQMADDLRLFLDDRPVQARRTSFTEQAWRWCRRNPAISALLSCVALLSIALVIALGAFAVRTQQFANDLQDENLRVLRAQLAETAAHTESRRSLYQAFFRQAQAERRNQLLGDREQTLLALEKAAELLPTLELGEEEVAGEKLALRNEAVQALVQTGITVDRVSVPKDVASFTLTHDPSYERFAISRGEIRLCNTSDGTILKRIPQMQFRATDIEFSRDGTFLASLHRRNKGEPRSVRVWSLEHDASVLEEVVNVTDMCFGPRNTVDDQTLFAFVVDEARVTVNRLRHTPRPAGESATDGISSVSREFAFSVRDVCFSPDGDRLAIVGDTYEVVFWDHATDQIESMKLPGRASAIDWSPSKDKMALGLQDGKILFFDGGAGDAEPQALHGHSDLIYRLVMSQQADMIATTSWDGTTRLWDVENGREFKRLGRGKVQRVQSRFSTDGSKLGCRKTDQSSVVYSIHRRDPRRAYNSDRDLPRRNDVSFHPECDHLAAVATSFHVELWDLRSEQIVQLVDTERCFRARFSPDGTRLITSGRRGTRLWDVAVPPDGQLTDDIVRNGRFLVEGNTYRLATSQDQTRIAYVTEDDRMVVYQIDAPDQRVVIGDGGFHSVAISPDGRWVAGQRATGVGLSVFDTATGEEAVDLLPKYGTTAIAFSPDSKHMIGNGAHGRTLWRVGSWEIVAQEERPFTVAGHAAFSPDGRYAIVSRDRFRLDLVDAHTLRILATLGDSRDRRIENVSFALDSERIAIAFADNFETWDLKSLRRQLHTLGLDWE